MVGDTKKEQFIQIGGRGHRIANDHHALLSQLHSEFRYMSMQDLLFLTSFIGARVIRTLDLVTLMKVDSCEGR